MINIFTPEIAGIFVGVVVFGIALLVKSII